MSFNIGDKATFDNSGKQLTGIIEKIYSEINIALVKVSDIIYKIPLVKLSAAPEEPVSDPNAKRFTRQDLKIAVIKHTGPKAFDNIPSKYDITEYAFLCVLAANLGNDMIDSCFENGETIEITAFNLVDQISAVCCPSHVNEYLPTSEGECSASECALISLGAAEMLLQIVPDLFEETKTDDV